MIKSIRLFRPFLLVFGLWSSVFSLQSFALDVPHFYGEEVVVTATRLPQSLSKSPWNTTVIASQELKAYRTVGDVLRGVAGIDSQANGSLGAVNSARLRGSNASSLLVLVDGRKINSPTLGMFDMGDLLLNNVEKIEVVRAPLSAIYGSDAISGVVNIITKTPKAGQNSLSVSTGSFGSQQFKMLVSGTNYLLSFDQLKSDGFKKNGDYFANSVFGKYIIQTPIGELFADGNYYDAQKGIQGVPTAESDPFSNTQPSDRQTDKNTFLNAGIIGDNYKLRAFQNTLDQKLNPYIFGATSTYTNQMGMEWQQTLNFGLGKFLYGLEAREDRAKGTMAGEHTISNYAAFIQDELDLNDRSTLVMSVRGDRHLTAGRSVNPRAGIVYRPTSDLILRASAGTAFRAPTLNELYWNDGYTYGDTNLKPEKSFSYEFGLERKLPAGTSARVNYFVSKVTDLVLWDWQSSTLETRAKNVGEVYSEGVEFELAKKLGENGKAFINYNYQNAIDKKDFNPLVVDKSMPYTPQTKFNLGLVLENSSLMVKHVGERFANQANTVKLPAYTVVDLKVSKKLTNIALEFSVSNLLDENYSEAIGNDPTTFAARKYPMPGRNYSLGVKWEI